MIQDLILSDAKTSANFCPSVQHTQTFSTACLWRCIPEDGGDIVWDETVIHTPTSLTMRRVQIFSGSSHPLLTDAICERLGSSPAKVELKKFSNGETSVSVETSIRDQDVFIVQSGSDHVNDSLMEMLIMISACKGGSAKSVTGQSNHGLG